MRTAATARPRVTLAANKPLSNSSQWPKSITRCLMPAKKWYSNADTLPHAISFAMKPFSNISTASLKPASDSRDKPNAYKANTAPKNSATPVARCTMEVIAGSGCLIVRRSKFTGLFLFTALVHTLRPLCRARLLGSVEDKYLAPQA